MPAVLELVLVLVLVFVPESVVVVVLEPPQALSKMVSKPVRASLY